jgi:hypothetical protein
VGVLPLILTTIFAGDISDDPDEPEDDGAVMKTMILFSKRHVPLLAVT